MVFSIVSSMSRKKYEQDKVEDEGSGEGSGKWDLYIPQGICTCTCPALFVTPLPGPAALPQEPSAKHGASSDSDDEVDAWENLQVLENDSSKSLSTGFRESMRRMGIAEVGEGCVFHISHMSDAHACGNTHNLAHTRGSAAENAIHCPCTHCPSTKNH